MAVGARDNQDTGLSDCNLLKDWHQHDTAQCAPRIHLCLLSRAELRNICVQMVNTLSMLTGQARVGQRFWNQLFFHSGGQPRLFSMFSCFFLTCIMALQPPYRAVNIKLVAGQQVSRKQPQEWRQALLEVDHHFQISCFMCQSFNTHVKAGKCYKRRLHITVFVNPTIRL